MVILIKQAFMSRGEFNRHEPTGSPFGGTFRRRRKVEAVDDGSAVAVGSA